MLDYLFIYLFILFTNNLIFQGDDCINSHDVDINKREGCKFYIQGYCLKGDKCLFMHGMYSLYLTINLNVVFTRGGRFYFLFKFK